MHNIGGQKKPAPQPMFLLQAKDRPPEICPIIGAGLGGDRAHSYSAVQLLWAGGGVAAL